MKVLMILYDFAPQNNCAAIPNTKLVKYLEKEEIELTLITNAITPDMNLDESLLTDNIRAIKRYYAQPSRLYQSTVGAQRTRITNNGVKLKMKTETRRFRAWTVLILKNLYNNLKGLDWIISAKNVVKKNLMNEHFDIVYSSYPTYEAHRLAEYLINKGIADKWVADFRDPMFYATYDTHRLEKKKNKQHRIERKADWITILSEGSKEKFLFIDVPESKITVIPNGYDPEDLVVNEETENDEGRVLRMFYAGTLYAGKRDLSILFKAASELINEGQVDRNLIQFEYAGGEWPVFEGFANQYGLSDRAVGYGYVTRKKVMEIMSEIDCSIVCSHNTSNDQGVITGKLFELLLVGKPIVAIMHGDIPNSELGEIVKKCDAGVVVEDATIDDDYPALKKWLYERYTEKLAKGTITQTINHTERDKYSYQTIAHEVYSIFKCLTD